MDFSLSEEQIEMQQLAQKILSEQVNADHLTKLEAEGSRFDSVIWKKLAKAGLLGIAIDECYGGMGFNFETLCLFVNEVGKTIAPVPVVPVLVSAALTVQEFANEDVKTELLPALAEGNLILTNAIHEDGISDLHAPQCQVKEANGKLCLAGQKHLVPYAGHAAYALVTAMKQDQLIILLIDMQANNIRKIQQPVTNGEPQFLLDFNDVELCRHHIIATGALAENALQWMLERTLTANCFLTLGVVETMLAMTAQYTSEREQFGRPIATFQAVSHRAADAYIDTSNLRLLCQQAAYLLSQGLDAGEAVVIAKIWASDVAHRVSQSSQHLHGGIGVDRDYPLFRYCLWAKQLELELGGSGPYLAKLGQAIADEFRHRVA